MALWILAFRNLWRNPRRTIVTGLALAIGFCGLNLFSGYVYRIERALYVGTAYLNYTGHLAILKRDWIEKGIAKPRQYSITPEEQSQIQSFLAPHANRIAYQAPLFLGVGLISNGCRSIPFYLRALNPELKSFARNNPDYLKWKGTVDPVFPGQDFSLFKPEEMPLMVTNNVRTLLNKEAFYTGPDSLPPPTISDCDTRDGKESLRNDPSVQMMVKTLDGGITALDANVVGTYSLGFSFLEDMGVESSLFLAQKLFDTEALSRWLVFLKTSKDVDDWRNTIRPQFESQFPSFEMLFYDEARLNPFYSGTKGFLSSLTFFFLLISGVAVALAVINSLTINILERSKEIGTLRALGFTQTQLAWLFGREMILLTAFSMICGAILTQFFTSLINNSRLTFNPPGSAAPVQLEIATDPVFQTSVFFGLCALVAVVSYVLANRRIRMNIAHLLIEA